MNDIFRLIGAVIFGLILGIFIGYFNEGLNLQWENKLSFDTIINLLIALVIAVFLQQAYQSRVESIRIEKDLIIDQLKESNKLLQIIKNDFKSLYSTQSSPKTFREKFVVNFRSLSNSLTSVKDLIECTNNQKSLLEKCDAVLLNCVMLKDVITGGNPEELYALLDSQKMENHSKTINKEIYTLIIEINRL